MNARQASAVTTSTGPSGSLESRIATTPGRLVAASTQASNTVVHSGSGRVEGMFTVHVTAIGQAAAGVAVTELRGAGFP